MTDMTPDRLVGNFAMHDHPLRKPESDDVLSASVAKLVGLAPSVPAFPKRATLASLDPLPSPKRNLPIRKAALLVLLALVGGAGVAIPRFASEVPTPNSKLIIRTLPKGLTLISLTERPGGEAYIGRSQFEWSTPQGDIVSLTATTDRETSAATLRAAGETVTRGPESKPSGPPYKTIKLPSGVEAFLLRIPEDTPQIDQLTWSQDGFDLTLFRTEPRKGLAELASIASQLEPVNRNDWMSAPLLPSGYREVSRDISKGEIRRTTTWFDASIVGPNNAFYSLSASMEPLHVPIPRRTNEPADKVETIGGKAVTRSVDGLSWTDDGLSIQLYLRSERAYMMGTPRKLAVLDQVKRGLVSAIEVGSLRDWRTQMAKRRVGFEKRESVIYRGIKLNHFLPVGDWTEDLVCIGDATLGSCQAISEWLRIGSFSLPDGRWMAIGSAGNLPDELLATARKRNVGPAKPRLRNQDGIFDVVTVGLDEVAVAIIPGNQEYVELGFNRGSVRRPGP
jgi:hypothetical protein